MKLENSFHCTGLQFLSKIHFGNFLGQEFGPWVEGNISSQFR
jgi:hypothetical protein